jgi:hypothetical protein
LRFHRPFQKSSNKVQVSATNRNLSLVFYFQYTPSKIAVAMSLQGEKPQPLPNKTLRLRLWMWSDDEESRIDCTSLRTLALDSGPIREEKTTAETATYKAKLRLDLVGEKTQKFFGKEIIPSTPCVFLCWGLLWDLCATRDS